MLQRLEFFGPPGPRAADACLLSCCASRGTWRRRKASSRLPPVSAAAAVEAPCAMPASEKPVPAAEAACVHLHLHSPTAGEKCNDRHEALRLCAHFGWSAAWNPLLGRLLAAESPYFSHHSQTLFEKAIKLGGMLTHWVPGCTCPCMPLVSAAAPSVCTAPCCSPEVSFP